MCVTWASNDSQHLSTADSEAEIVDGCLFVSSYLPWQLELCQPLIPGNLSCCVHLGTHTHTHTFTQWKEILCTYEIQTCTHMQRFKEFTDTCVWRQIIYLIVQVVDLQLVAPSAVGEVETAVFFSREQLGVLMLLKRQTGHLFSTFTGQPIYLWCVRVCVGLKSTS